MPPTTTNVRCLELLGAAAHALDITKPMDLATVLRNVKSHKYKNKADFGTDVDQIWQNCLIYNTSAVGDPVLCGTDGRTTLCALSRSLCDKRQTTCSTLLPTAMPPPTIH